MAQQLEGLYDISTATDEQLAEMAQLIFNQLTGGN